MVPPRGIEPRSDALQATAMTTSAKAAFNHIETHLNSPSTLVAISLTIGRNCMCFNMVAGYKIRRYTFGVTVLPIPSPTSFKTRRLYTR